MTEFPLSEQLELINEYIDYLIDNDISLAIYDETLDEFIPCTMSQKQLAHKYVIDRWNSGSKPIRKLLVHPQRGKGK